MKFSEKFIRFAPENVTLQLIQSKCIPALLYGLEACPVNKADLNSLDFVVNRFFMKLFCTGNINIVRECQIMFRELLEKRTKKFIHDYDKFAAPLIYSDAHCG